MSEIANEGDAIQPRTIIVRLDRDSVDDVRAGLKLEAETGVEGQGRGVSWARDGVDEPASAAPGEIEEPPVQCGGDATEAQTRIDADEMGVGDARVGLGQELDEERG